MSRIGPHVTKKVGKESETIGFFSFLSFILSLFHLSHLSSRSRAFLQTSYNLELFIIKGRGDGSDVLPQKESGR